MTTTPRLAMPYLVPGQGQKEMTHNEALAILDLAVQPSVSGGPVDVPPATAVEGECMIVGKVPTGAFVDRADHLAIYQDAGWRFVAPREGFACFDTESHRSWRYDGSEWTDGVHEVSVLKVNGETVIGPRGPAIALPEGGATVDGEARATLEAVVQALRDHGLIAS